MHNKSVALYLEYVKYMIMELIVLPFGVLLWYLAYDAKPQRKDEVGSIWEEEQIVKRIKLSNLINEINN